MERQSRCRLSGLIADPLYLQRYYTEYGLAIRGLVRHHQVDREWLRCLSLEVTPRCPRSLILALTCTALDYDAQCDAALPLETVLKPSAEMQALLKDIDRSRFRVWALTNAYYNVSRLSYAHC